MAESNMEIHHKLQLFGHSNLRVMDLQLCFPLPASMHPGEAASTNKRRIKPRSLTLQACS